MPNIKTINRLSLFLIAIICLGASCNVKEDTSPLSAYDADDLSAIMATSGDGPRKGIAHVYAVVDTPSKNYRVTISVPEVSCDRDNCAEVRVINKTGMIIPIGGIAGGKNKYTFSLDKIIQPDDKITKEDGGPYRVIVDVYQDLNREYHRRMVGVLYITVLDQGYPQLSCNSPDVSYIEKVTEECDAHYTTKLRSVLCCKEVSEW